MFMSGRERRDLPVGKFFENNHPLRSLNGGWLQRLKYELDLGRDIQAGREGSDPFVGQTKFLTRIQHLRQFPLV